MKIPVVTDLEQDIFAIAEIGDTVQVDGNSGVIKVIKN